MRESNGPNLIRLFGGPGSGKTTALLNEVEGLLDSGIDVKDLLGGEFIGMIPGEFSDSLDIAQQRREDSD